MQDATADWVLPQRYRLRVTVDPGVSSRHNSPVGVELDFKELFQAHSIAGRLDLQSIRIVHYDPLTGKPIRYQGDPARSTVPHQLTGDFENDDAGMVWWRIPDGQARNYHLYFDITEQGQNPRPSKVALVGIGDTFHYNHGRPGFAGNAALHSVYWNLDWDGDGLRDLIGFGYRVFEYGLPLERELGNWIYFWKNIGTQQRPLYAPRYRLKGEDGNYLTSPNLPQNMFPVDWDEDGDIDFHGMWGDRLLLWENTGQRDRNGLWILRQARELLRLEPRSEFQKGLPVPDSVPAPSSFYFRGERMVDWEGDGDLDMIAAYRAVNQIGTEDPKKGIIPYGGGWQMFNLLRRTGTGPNHVPIFSSPETLFDERGLPLVAVGSSPAGAECVDYDSDGDLDLLFFQETNSPLQGGSWLMLAENVGTRRRPLFVMPLPVLEISGWPQVVDWNGDGRFDLITGGEFFENVNLASGRPPARENDRPLGTYLPTPKTYPRFVSRGLAQQVDPSIHAYFTVCTDWNGDGVLDLVSGFHSNLLFLRNRGTNLDPVFDEGVKIEAGGSPIFMPNWLDPQSDTPSHWGPQGLGEAIYGWLNPSVGDWDGDGDLDLFVTAQRWQLMYFENVGSRTHPRLAAGREVLCDGDPLEFSWRSKVSVGDLNGDGHAELVVTSHQDNTFYMYQPGSGQDGKSLPVSRGPALLLEDGHPVQGWYGGQNNNGDNHSLLVDWDGDGDLDLLNGSLWAVWYYENVGTPSHPVFRPHGRLTAGGEVIHTFNHAGSFDAADWNGDGRIDLVMGTECPSDQPMGGVLHLFDRAFLDNDLCRASVQGFEAKETQR